MEVVLGFQVADDTTLVELQHLKSRIFEALSAMPGKPVPAKMMLELGPRYLSIDSEIHGKSTPA